MSSTPEMVETAERKDLNPSKVGSAPVDGDDARLAVLDAGLPQEPVRCIRIRLSCEKEIHGLPACVDGPVEIFRLAADLEIRLIEPPTVSGFAFGSPERFLQQRRISRDPPGDRRMINGYAAFGEKLLHIAVAERIGQVPADSLQDDCFSKCLPLNDIPIANRPYHERVG